MKNSPAHSILSVMAISALFCLGMAACVDSDQATADDQQVQAPDDDLTLRETATPEPADSPKSSMKPIAPWTRWCAWPPSCTDPDAACCTATCMSWPDGSTHCSND